MNTETELLFSKLTETCSFRDQLLAGLFSVCREVLGFVDGGSTYPFITSERYLGSSQLVAKESAKATLLRNADIKKPLVESANAMNTYTLVDIARYSPENSNHDLMFQAVFELGADFDHEKVDYKLVVDNILNIYLKEMIEFAKNNSEIK